MWADLHSAYLWCAGLVALLALVGSFDFKRLSIDDSELLKATSAVAVHTLFHNLWFAYVRSADAVGQPWLLYCITLSIVAWMVTVRPASKWSAVICGSCMFGILTSAVCGTLRLMQGFDAQVDMVNWITIFLMACFNLLILASWSCGNIGRRLGVFGARETAQASGSGVA